MLGWPAWNTYSNIRGDKISGAERMDKCSPIVEHYEQDAEQESIVRSEQLTVRAIRILLVVSIVSGSVLQRVVFGGSLDPVVKLNIR